MLRRLLDRLAELVKCEPKWAGMWDDIPLPGDEPTVLAWTPDAEMERGTEEFKRLWPDKWDAWVRWCEAEES